MITVISATNRKGSQTIKIAEFYCQLLKNERIECQLLDLTALPSNFLFTNFNGKSTDEFKQIVDEFLSKATKFIVISPEYHGSYPGVFKAFVDCISENCFQNKKIALVGVASGRLGNIRGLEHLTSLFHHLKAEVYSSKPKLSEIHQLVDEEGILTNPQTISLIENQINGFMKF